mgnify:FL=1
MYDPANVFVGTADSDGASNGIVAIGAIKIHKVVLEGDGSNVLTVQLHNQASITGTAEISLAANEVFATEFKRYTEANFSPPVRFGVGLSVNITGNAGTYRVYYSR